MIWYFIRLRLMVIAFVLAMITEAIIACTIKCLSPYAVILLILTGLCFEIYCLATGIDEGLEFGENEHM